MINALQDALLTATHEVLDTFEDELPGLDEASDEKISTVVERVALAPKAMNDAHDGAAFETDEREELCDHIDQSLSEHGVDLVGLTARHGLGRHQLTDTDFGVLGSGRRRSRDRVGRGWLPEARGIHMESTEHR
ncbi:hypothetical protein AB0D86_47220 [Streptomyces sp. NPDC048324]|uniref:hypothetical protein n=1 Tax=Streptomyces sp. NPDC048324 TaxID=3157205 RepID=UPI0034292371